MAETRTEAKAVFDAFVETCGVKYDKAADCPIKDGGAAGLLRLSRRALEALADVESD